MKCKNCKHNTFHEEENEQYSWCKARCDNLDIDEERNCNYYVPATNGDCIRAMTDEQLSDFLIGILQRGGVTINGNLVKVSDWIKHGVYDG